MVQEKQFSIKQAICASVIATERMNLSVCQGLAIKLAKKGISSSPEISADEMSYISRQAEIAANNIAELGLTEQAKNAQKEILNEL